MLLVFALGVNVAVLVELCVAMALAVACPPERFTPVFLKVFFGLLAPTLVLAGLGKRLLLHRLRSRRDPA